MNMARADIANAWPKEVTSVTVLVFRCAFFYYFLRMSVQSTFTKNTPTRRVMVRHELNEH